MFLVWIMVDMVVIAQLGIEHQVHWSDGATYIPNPISQQINILNPISQQINTEGTARRAARGEGRIVCDGAYRGGWLG